MTEAFWAIFINGVAFIAAMTFLILSQRKVSQKYRNDCDFMFLIWEQGAGQKARIKKPYEMNRQEGKNLLKYGRIMRSSGLSPGTKAFEQYGEYQMKRLGLLREDNGK